MDFSKIINSLDLLYYEYNEKNKVLIPDNNYSNKYVKLEFFKITYYLSKYNIEFKVLRNKSIQLSNGISNIKYFFDTCLEKLRNKNKNIFLLNNTKAEFAKNIPLFKIEYLKKELDLSKYDALVFTSKNAVLSIDSMNKQWIKIPSYAISEQTAKLIKDLKGNLAFSGKEKHGDEFAYELIKKLKGKKVLYLRGEDIVSDLINILNKNHVKCKDSIIYKNKYIEVKDKKKLPKNSKIIFSSPSTIKYFFKSFKWDKSYKAIAIGKTTAKYFPSDIKPFIAKNTSIKACIEKALEIK